MVFKTFPNLTQKKIPRDMYYPEILKHRFVGLVYGGGAWPMEEGSGWWFGPQACPGDLQNHTSPSAYTSSFEGLEPHTGVQQAAGSR